MGLVIKFNEKLQQYLHANVVATAPCNIPVWRGFFCPHKVDEPTGCKRMERNEDLKESD